METSILVYSSGDPFGNHLQHSAYDQLIEGNESNKHNKHPHYSRAEGGISRFTDFISRRT